MADNQGDCSDTQRVMEIAWFTHADHVPLDPMAAAIVLEIDRLTSYDRRLAHDPPQVDLLRAIETDLVKASGDPSADAEVADVLIPGIGRPNGVRVRTYRPLTPGGGQLVLNVHGGGWCLGSVDAEDHWCRALAAATGAVVVSVDYRLAPEHPYPAGLEDVSAALAWVLAETDDLGVTASRVAVMGNSSGANLATSACLWARNHQVAQPAAMVLWYPALDDALSSPSAREFERGIGFTTGSIRRLWELYLGGAAPSEYAAPARTPSVAGLPEALVITAEHDPLRDEGETFARRLSLEGGRVQLRRFGGMPHGFIAHADRLEAARAAQELTFAFVRSLGEQGERNAVGGHQDGRQVRPQARRT